MFFLKKIFLDTNVFWEYSKKILLFPLSKRTYKNKEYAMSACLLEKECTGISYWKKRYRPVSGKELISTKSKGDTAYIKTGKCSVNVIYIMVYIVV